MSRESTDAVSIKESRHKATIQWGWGTVVYRVVVAAAAFSGLLIFSAFWYHSDAHNDRRYVQLRDYERDRATDKAVTDERTRSLDRELSAQRGLLEEMRADVKQLLRKP